jgi:hypothetical protein
MIIKQITTEAKKIRKLNPKLTWQQSLKKAGLKFRGKTSTAIKKKPIRKKTTTGSKITLKSTGIKKIGKTIGSFFNNVQNVAKQQNVNLRGADLDYFFKFLIKNQQSIFGKKITQLDYDDLFDTYPQLVDVISQNRIDTDILDEDDTAGDRLWNKAKKSKLTGLKLPSTMNKKIPLKSTGIKKISGNVPMVKTQKKFGALPGPSDPDAVREIEIFIENDYDLYKSRLEPILLNLQKKYLKGVYKIEPAAKLFRYLIDDGMKKYHKVYMSRNTPWYQLLSTTDRQYLAEKMAKDTLIELNTGNRW